jgi:hypothetical protein
MIGLKVAAVLVTRKKTNSGQTLKRDASAVPDR